MPVFAPPPLSSGPRSGTWRLQPGQALSLRASHCGLLWVAVGSLWTTTDGPHRGAANARGDRVLQAGERLSVRAGERIVIEPIGGDARFEWHPVSPGMAGRRWPAALRWRASVLRALPRSATMWLAGAGEPGRRDTDGEPSTHGRCPPARSCAPA